MRINKIILILLISIMTFFFGCDLDIDNPNSPTEEAIKSYDGLVLVGIGLQARLSQGIGQTVTVTGAVSGETSPVIAYLGYQPLRKYTDNSARIPLEKDNTYARILWREQYRIVKTANDILISINSVAMSDASRRSFIALANVGKVMAFYVIMHNWEKLPIYTNTDHPEFVDRNAAVDECISLLNDAEAQLSGITIPDDFQDNVLGTGFDLVNLVQAYKARIYLMDSEYGNAAAAAGKVTAEAQFVYAEGVGLNPLYNHFTQSYLTKGMAYWADDAEPGDLRVPATVDMLDGEVRYGDDSVYAIIKYNTPSAPFNIFTLNEMTLIKAECYARGGGGDPEAEVNKIRSAAGLTAFDGSTSILEEIFKQRFYELYLTGQHLENFRRFENDGIAYVDNLFEAQLAHYWLVYVDWEIDKNPNCPPQQTRIDL
ncbi:RagB/SusD family nutrient uptake outer membrane protein [Bacteroidota bacterium]